MDCTNYKDRILRIKTLFAKAEAICKRVESDPEHEGGAVIPAINQLRYAGQHLISACASDDVNVQSEELTKSENHCQRAVYDAAEAACLIVKLQIDSYQKQFQSIVISEVVPSYSSTLRAHVELKKIIGSRRDDVSKQDHYETLLQTFEILNDGLLDLEAHEEELKKALRITKRNLWFVAAGLVVAIASLFFTVYKPDQSNEQIKEQPSKVAQP